MQDALACTEVATIKGILSFGTEGLETPKPCCGGCVDLEVVRVDAAGPFPTLQGVRYVVLVGHGLVPRTKIRSPR